MAQNSGSGNNRINFEINFKKGDLSELQKVKNEINDIQKLLSKSSFTEGFNTQELQNMTKAAYTLNNALDQAFDFNLNTFNVQKFNKILKESGYSAESLKRDLSLIGPEGQKAFLNATNQLMQFNTVTKQTNKFLDGIAISLGNTIKWSIMSSVVKGISGTIQKSFYYVKDLNRELNDIRIVTGKSADEMARFAESANNAAKSLAVSTEDYTQGSLIYYQQGLDDETVKTLTDITAKTSNVTGQAMSTVSEHLTAVWNGYQVANEAAEEGMQVYQEYVDKMAAVGATTASNLEELSTAMSKVASAASSMGVDFDDLNAQIATIVSVTRQAPESVGTALKTIYARLGDLKVDGVDEFGTKLGEVSSQLKTMGIDILDTNGDMRQMTDVMAEVAEKWEHWTSAQKQAASIAMAGKRQYNNLVALFDNWDMYGEALETSMNAAGTLEKQQEIAMQSLAKKMTVLKVTAEDLYDSLFNVDTITGWVEAGTGVLQFLADFTDSIGGLNNLIPMLGSLGLQIFSGQIGKGLSTIVINARNARMEMANMISSQQALQSMFQESDFLVRDPNQQHAISENLREMVGFYEEMSQYQSIMTQEQKQQYNEVLRMKDLAGNLGIELEKQTYDWLTQSKYLKVIDSDLVKDLDNLEGMTNQVTKLNKIIEAIEFGKGGGILSQDMFDTLIKDLNLTEDEFDQLIGLFNSDFKSAGENINEALDKSTGRLRKFSEGLTNIIEKSSRMKSLNQNFKDMSQTLSSNMGIQAFITNTTRALGALGQLASSMTTISNLATNVWNNDTLSNNDKLLQTITNLGFTFPMLITSITGFTKALGIENTMFKALRLAKEKDIALSTLQGKKDEYLRATKDLLNTQQQYQVINISKTITAKELEEVATNKMTAAELAQKKVAEANIGANGLVTEAITKQISAKVANANATNASTAANKAWNASFLGNPVALVTVAIVALTAALIAYNKIQEESIKKQVEANQKRIEEINSIQQQVDANEEIYNSYMKTQDAYLKNEASKEDMQKVTEDLVKLYDLEINRLEILAGNYDSVTKAATEARKAELERARGLAEEEKSKAYSNIYSEASLKDNQKVFRGSYGANSNTEDRLVINYLEDKFANEDNWFFQSGQGINNNSINSKGLSYKIEIENSDDAIKTYHQLNEFLTDIAKKDSGISESIYTQSKDYQEILSYVNQMKPYVDAYESAMKDVAKYEAELQIYDIGLDKVKNLDEFTKKFTELKNNLQQIEGLDIKDIDKVIYEIIPKISDDAAKYLTEQDILEDLSKQFDKTYGYIKSWWENLPEAERTAVLEGKVDLSFAVDPNRARQDIQEALNNLGTFDVKSPVELSTTLVNGTKLKKEDKEKLGDLESGVASSMAGFENKGLYNQFDTIDEITQYRIEKNQEYLNNVEKETEKSLQRRQKDAEEYLKREFGTKEDYNSKLAELEEKTAKGETDEALQAQIEGYQKLEDEVERLNQIKQEGLSFEEIEDVGFNDLISSIDLVVNKAELAKNAAEMIGKGFTVAASDVEKFSHTFPDMLEGMETLADGSIKLNKEVVNEQLGAIQEEVQARTDARLQDIDQQIKLKEVEQKYLQEKLSALSDYLKGEKTSAETIDKIRKAGYDYRTSLMDLTGQNIEELEKFSISSANSEGQVLLKMLDQVGKGFAKAAKAHYAMLKGENFDWGEELNFSGTASTAEEFALNNGAKAREVWAKNKQEYEQLYNEAQEVQSQLNQVTGELDTLRAQRGILESTTKAAGNAIDRVKAGKAGKEDKSKSGKDKKKDLKELDEEFDRYWQIKKAIDMLDLSINRLRKDQKNLHGQELIDSLKKENELLAEQKANYEALYKMQQEEQAELQAKLAGSGVIFDASGAITNYAQATAAALAQYTAAVNAYNAGLIDDTAFKVQEKAYENFKKTLERYEALYYKEMQDTQDKIDDARRKQLENNLKAWETEIQIKLDLQEAERQWADFLKNITEDFQSVFKDLTVDMDTLLSKSKTYTGKNGKDGTIGADIAAIEDVMREIDIMRNGGESSMFESISQAQEKLKELQEKLQKDAQALRDLWKEGWELYLKQIDQVADKFEALQKRFNDINNQIKFYADYVKLVFGDKAYKTLDKIYKAQEKATKNQLEAAKREADMWKEEFEKSGADINNPLEWTEDQKKFYENWINAQENVNSLALDYVKILQEDYLNTVDDIYDALEKSLYGMSLDDIAEEWERISYYSDHYLDNIEKSYETQKLANKIDQDIASTSNLRTQQKLQEFRDKYITQLRERKEITQYELDATEAKYQIMLKEAALEDAMNNKTTMKMTRNDQGNWSYQYVADEDDAANKRQELLDSYNELYQLATKAFQANLEASQQLAEDYAQKSAEIAKNFYGEERLQKQLELDAWYEEESARLTQQNQIIKNDLRTAGAGLVKEIYEQDEEAARGMTDNEIAMVEELKDAGIDNFMDLEESVVTNYKNIGDTSSQMMADTQREWTATANEIIKAWTDKDGVKDKLSKATYAIQKAFEDYQAKVKQCSDLIDFDLDDLDSKLNKLTDDTDKLKDKTDELADQSTDDLDKMRDAVEALREAWEGVEGKIMDTINKLKEYINLQVKANGGGGTGNSGNGGGGGNNGGGGGGGNSGNSGDDDKGKNGDNKNEGKKWKIIARDIIAPGTPRIIVEKDIPDSEINAKLAKYQGQEYSSKLTKVMAILNDDPFPDKFLSGGYTGDWGNSNGRSAILHQKELVLNKQDTSNFLQGISLLRDMTALNGSISGAISNTVMGMAMSLGTMTPSGYSGSSSTETNNGGDTFNITAEFPNANDVNEIREAILSLPRLASQYIGRNLK